MGSGERYGAKRYFGTAFVIDGWPTSVAGETTSTDLVDFWKFDRKQLDPVA